MTIRDILLVLQGGDDCGAQLAIAARLARENDAMVDGVCVYPEPELAASDFLVMADGDADDLLQRRDAQIRALVAPIKGAYDHALTEHGRSKSWTAGEVEERTWAIIRQSRLADLVVLGVPGRDSIAHRLAECLAMQSGAPCLLAPPHIDPDRGFARVLFAWDGSKEAKRAMDGGMAFMKQAAAAGVVIIHEDRDPQSHTAHGHALIAHLAHHGVDAELIVVSEPGMKIGEALLRQCDAFAADLLIMGAYCQPRMNGIVLGRATRTMLGHAKQPVLMAH